MSKLDLEIEMGSTLGQRLQRAHDAALERAKATGGEPLTIGELVTYLIARGLDADARLASGAPVIGLTVGELGNMLGLPDAEAARIQHAKARAMGVEAVEKAAAIFQDIEALRAQVQGIIMPTRLRSAQEVEQFAKAWKEQLTMAGPAYSIAVVAAVLDEGARPYFPMPSTPGVN